MRHVVGRDASAQPTRYQRRFPGDTRSRISGFYSVFLCAGANRDLPEMQMLKMLAHFFNAESKRCRSTFF
jgi:hypothetical protein